MGDITENLIDVQPEFAALLGLSVSEVKALSLRELSNRAFSRGYDLSVSSGRSVVPGAGRLRLVTVRRPDPPHV